MRPLTCRLFGNPHCFGLQTCSSSIRCFAGVKENSSEDDHTVSIKRLCDQHKALDLNYRHYKGTDSGAAPIVILHGLFGQLKNWAGPVRLLQKQIPNDARFHSVKCCVCYISLKRKTLANIVSQSPHSRKSGWLLMDCSFFQIYVPDLRNHGESPHSHRMSILEMAADVEKLIETGIHSGVNEGQQQQAAESRRPAIVLGHSLGGKVAAALALTRSDIVQKLILEDITPKHSGLSKMQNSTFHDIPKYIKALVALQPSIESDFPLGDRPSQALSKARKFAEEQLKGVVKDPIILQFLLTNLVARKGVATWSVNVNAFDKHFGDIIDFPFENQPDFTGGNESFQGPTLVVSGENSSYVTQDDHSIFRDFFPDVGFVQIEGAGHWVHSEKPQAFVDVVAEFINGSL